MQFSAGVLLFILFLVLKLTDVIDWSWLWVTSPLWIGFVLFVVFVAISFPVWLTASKRDREFDKEFDRLINRRRR